MKADPASGRSQAYEEMTLRDLRELADRTPGMRKRKKVGEKWVHMQKEELLEQFSALEAKTSAQALAGPKTRGATADPASGNSQAYEDMALRDLQELATRTPGMRTQKKVGESG